VSGPEQLDDAVTNRGYLPYGTGY
ncbi:MAG: hypothetical protein RL328_1154, partial [Acidobacteriota bacterium]